MAIIGQAAPSARGQILAEEAVARDYVIGIAQPRQHQVPQTGAHRIAHQQRAAQHAGRGRHAQQHGQVRAPIPRRDYAPAAWRFAYRNSYRAGNLEASSALCVTTIRMVSCR